MTFSPRRQPLIWLVAIMASLASRVANAQGDPAQIVRASEADSAGLATMWLASADPRTRAWGAFLASRIDTSAPEWRAIVNQLTTLAKNYQVRPQPLSVADRDDHDAMAGVLDALIETGWDDRLPPPAAAALYPEFPAQAVILLSHRQGLVSPQAWDIVRRETAWTGGWLAAVNMLRMDRAPGLASFLLAGLTVYASIAVVDEHPTLGGGTGASCASGGSPPPRSGWPPVGNYHLTAGSGALVANGVDPVFYTRSVGAADSGPPPVDNGCDWQLAADGDWHRARVLASLVGEWPDHPSVNWSVAKTVTWRGSTTFLADLSSFVSAQESSFAGLAAKLLNAGLLTPDEARTARPIMELRIDDRRGTRTSALPEVTDLPDNVRVVKQ